MSNNIPENENNQTLAFLDGCKSFEALLVQLSELEKTLPIEAKLVARGVLVGAVDALSGGLL